MDDKNINAVSTVNTKEIREKLAKAQAETAKYQKQLDESSVKPLLDAINRALIDDEAILEYLLANLRQDDIQVIASSVVNCWDKIKIAAQPQLDDNIQNSWKSDDEEYSQ